MSYPLAVFTYQLGSLSETFIRRHIEDLLPGGTTVVSAIDKDEYGGNWTVDCPVLVLERAERDRLRHQILAAVLRTAGCNYYRERGVDAVRALLRKNGVQVVLAEYLHTWVRWVEVVKDLGIRFFVHGHGVDVSRYLKDETWRKRYAVYGKADGVITMSQANKRRLGSCGLEPEKIHVVPYGVSVPPAMTGRVRRDTVRCLAVGRMVAKKAPILTLDAFRRALEKNPRLRLDYVGGGDLLPAAMQFVRAFELEGRVRLHGARPSDHILRLMRESDIFLQHSVTDPITGDEEGLPVSILEAMANGMPVLSTRHAGIPEAVLEGETGYLVDEGDSSGMAERLIELGSSPDLRAKMGEAGWRRAAACFSWERERGELLRVLGLDGSHPS
jgi:colanic acid/amylovoran biosynthesis glycosyltransferase